MGSRTKNISLTLVLGLGALPAADDIDILREQVRIFEQARVVVSDELKLLDKQGFGEKKPLTKVVSIERWEKLSPRLRAEWALRIPALRARLKVSDFRAIEDPDFLDQILWVYFRDLTPSIFLTSAKHKEVHAQMKLLLASLPQERLLRGARWVWWAEFLGAETQDDVTVPVLLQAFKASKARKTPDELVAMFAQFEAMEGSLGDSEEQVRADKRDGQAWVVGRVAAPAFLKFAGDTPKDASRAEVIGRMAVRLAYINKNAVTRAELFEQSLRLSAKYDFQVALMAAADWMLAGRPLKARELALTSVERPDVPGTIVWRFWELAADASVAAKDLPWATEYLRRALNSGLSSVNRDSLLERYGDMLAKQGFGREAIEIKQALFKGGTDRTRRLRALGAIIDARLLGLEKGGKTDLALEELRQTLSDLSFFARADSKRDVLRSLIVRAQKIVVRLGMDRDPQVVATLKEAELFAR